MLQQVVDFLMAFGIWGLALHSFIDAIIFPIPAFFTQVSLSLLDPANAIWLSTAGFIACLLGTPIGYMIGKLVGNSVLYKILKKSWVEKANALFQKNGEAAVLIGSFTPIPFKVFTILSGCMNFSLWRLLGYAAIGRAVKFYVVGILIYMYGNAAESMVKDVSLYIFLTAVPLILIFLWVRRIWRNKKKSKETVPSQSNGSDAPEPTEDVPVEAQAQAQKHLHQ